MCQKINITITEEKQYDLEGFIGAYINEILPGYEYYPDDVEDVEWGDDSFDPEKKIYFYNFTFPREAKGDGADQYGQAGISTETGEPYIVIDIDGGKILKHYSLKGKLLDDTPYSNRTFPVKDSTYKESLYPRCSYCGASVEGEDSECSAPWCEETICEDCGVVCPICNSRFCESCLNSYDDDGNLICETCREELNDQV